MDPFKLLEEAQKYQKTQEGKEKIELYTVNLNPRMTICARPGYVLSSLDYKNQELFIAAVASRDPVMLDVFSPAQPDYIYDPKDPERKEYPNPKKDLHTLTTVGCEPSYFKDKPLWEWVKIAKTKGICPHIKGSLRDLGKIINFGAAYMITPQAMSDNNALKLEKCKKWLNDFQKTYSVFWAWAQRTAKIAKVRGWIDNADGRVRMINDFNSKGLDSAGERMAVNFMIQGLGASMAKRAQIEILKAFEDTPARMLGLCHDEIIIEVPGSWEIDEEASFDIENKLFQPVFKRSEEAIYWTDIAYQCLVKAEEFYFSRLYPNADLKGLVEYEIAPYWAH